MSEQFGVSLAAMAVGRVPKVFDFVSPDGTIVGELPLGLDTPCYGQDAENMDTKRALSTGQAAKRLGISVRTLYRWEAAGRLHPMTRMPRGERRFAAREVDALLRARTGATEQCAVYARVSSEKQAEAGNLERQRECLVEAAMAKGYGVAAVGAERASGLNEKRRGLQRLFRLAAAGEIDVVLIEFKDRLARFGFAYLVEALQAHGVRVDVLRRPVVGLVAGDARVAQGLAPLRSHGWRRTGCTPRRRSGGEARRIATPCRVARGPRCRSRAPLLHRSRAPAPRVALQPRPGEHAQRFARWFHPSAPHLLGLGQ